MGNIILNLNISTSAVFRPLLVSQFMSDPETFSADKRANALKGKTVYIERDRVDEDAKRQAGLNKDNSRYYKVPGIQKNGNIENLTFRKKVVVDGPFQTNADGSYVLEPNLTRVVDHLKQGKTRPPLAKASVLTSTSVRRAPCGGHSCCQCWYGRPSHLVRTRVPPRCTLSAVYSPRP